MNDDLTKEKQKNIMKEWFFSNYEDPACECPYDGREGGYQYIYGGPYDAEEILSDEFNGVFPEEIIKELSTELFKQCWQWSAKPTQDWYEDYEFEIKDAYATFIENLKQIDDLLTVEIKPVLENSYNKMLFVSIITALETYLKDKFMFNLFKSNGSINCLLSKNQEIKKQSYNLLMIHNDPNFVNHKIKEFLYNKMWHNLPKINGLYQQAFDIKLNLNKMLIEAVEKRHDIVHRNGKTKDDIELKVAKEDIINLKENVNNLVVSIEESFEQYKQKELEKTLSEPF